MPGDPKECRQHAERCAACPNVSIPTSKRTVANLAWTWIKLADDLERNLTFLAGLDDDTDAERLTA